LGRVGDEEVTIATSDGAMRRVLQQAQRQNPEATYSTIANQFDPVLDS
jgi:hypothetical protein